MLCSDPSNTPDKSDKHNADQSQRPDRKKHAPYPGGAGLLKRQTRDAEQNTGDFEAAAGQLLQSLRYSRADFVHHLQRVLNGERYLGSAPRSKCEFSRWFGHSLVSSCRWAR